MPGEREIRTSLAPPVLSRVLTVMDRAYASPHTGFATTRRLSKIGRKHDVKHVETVARDGQRRRGERVALEDERTNDDAESIRPPPLGLAPVYRHRTRDGESSGRGSAASWGSPARWRRMARTVPEGVVSGILSLWKMFGGHLTRMVYRIHSECRTTTAESALSSERRLAGWPVGGEGGRRRGQGWRLRG